MEIYAPFRSRDKFIPTRSAFIATIGLPRTFSPFDMLTASFLSRSVSSDHPSKLYRDWIGLSVRARHDSTGRPNAQINNSQHVFLAMWPAIAPSKQNWG